MRKSPTEFRPFLLGIGTISLMALSFPWWSSFLANELVFRARIYIGFISWFVSFFLFSWLRNPKIPKPFFSLEIYTWTLVLIILITFDIKGLKRSYTIERIETEMATLALAFASQPKEPNSAKTFLEKLSKIDIKAAPSDFRSTFSDYLFWLSRTVPSAENRDGKTLDDAHARCESAADRLKKLATEYW